MSQADVLRWLIVVVVGSSVVGTGLVAWWERRHPSSFEPAVADEQPANRS